MRHHPGFVARRAVQPPRCPRRRRRKLDACRPIRSRAHENLPVADSVRKQARGRCGAEVAKGGPAVVAWESCSCPPGSPRGPVAGAAPGIAFRTHRPKARGRVALVGVHADPEELAEPEHPADATFPSTRVSGFALSGGVEQMVHTRAATVNDGDFSFRSKRSWQVS